MIKTKSLLLFLLLPALLAVSCRKKEWDAFYGRPGTLPPPIYQQLAGKGNFNHLLALIDKSGYRETLESGAGYWTLFAPNDAAFETYLTDNKITDIAAIDAPTARAMVQYMLVYNAFQKDRLDDYQASENNTGWTLSTAFRRRTAYYTGFYKDTSATGPVMAIATNRNNTAGSLTGNYVSADYNNKYLTYFTEDYMSRANLSAADYNYFYPNSQYTGFNVAQAKVVTADIPAENGVIHEIDKVITPLQSIDEYIRTRPEYSSFRAMLNRLFINNTVQFIYNEEVTKRYQVLTGSGNQVYVKVYSPLLAYAPNNENFLKIGDNDGQKDCWTMFAPNNAATDAYLKNTLLKYYPSLDSVPVSIIADFLNAHMFPTAVWPSKFASTVNTFSEPARFDLHTDVIEKKILSNGIFYGTNKIEQADIFSTVYGEGYLNPRYTFMTRLFNTSGLKFLIAKSNIPVNIFLVPDAVFLAAGFTYNSNQSQFLYKGSTNGVPDRLDRIIRTCVFFGNYKPETDDLSGSAVVKSGDADGEGEYIKFNNYKIVTAGLEDAGLEATVDSVKTSANGKVYYLDNIPLYSENGIGYHLGNLGDAVASDFNYFWQLMRNAAGVFSQTTNQIVGLTGYSTLFVPTNAAIQQAVDDGLLPRVSSTGAPNFKPSAPADVEKVRKFLYYHILATHTAVPDGNTDAAMYDTYLKNSIGTTLKVRVENYKNAMNILDDYGRTAHVIMAQSNNLSNRCVIHLIDNYLKYNDQ
ncbi:fasciclin domain-containing protein [Niabella aurantiaca]|uniref:fasciclin domain-containing protein n=1 Tax=Niabella aurantiaca TaxID=379900 RepID=UPI00039D8943|nr:fasciclin domain-containing protein [Niabella aurantiaca]